MTDEQLMERLQQGETDALDELYRRYARVLYAFCNNAARSTGPQGAEDLVHDVFERVIKAAHTFNPKRAAFRTWVFRIARNRCIDVARRQGRVRMVPLGKSAEQGDRGVRVVDEETIADQSADVEGSGLRTLVAQAVRDCIDELENEDERLAIVSYYLAGKVYREIGAILGKSTSMARNRVKAARDKVRRCLERKGVAPTV